MPVLSDTSEKKRALSRLVAESPAMRAVVESVDAWADEQGPVLVLGENGTGRELIARILHNAASSRARELGGADGRAREFTILHGGLVSPTVLDAVRGGTLLVKDLCELAKASQEHLCASLSVDFSEQPISRHARVIGSCDIDLHYAVDAGVFSAALYQLFAARTITVPALRDRSADIPTLTTLLIREYGSEIGKQRMSLSVRAFERLVSYPWPGNVAELKGIARRLVYRATASRIEAGDVDAVLPVVAERVPLEDMSLEEMVRSKLTAFMRRVDGYPVTGLYEDVVTRIEKPMLELVMSATGGNQLRAAEILGLNRNTLRRKLNDHGMLRSRARVSETAETKPIRNSRARKNAN